ncbi:MAG: hypothetical protein E7B59_12590 [Enterobacteriaceae bacterium]|nr:hypothetical protein [Enterobacteriaceae bacterium]
MTTTNQAIDFASEFGVAVSVDVQGYKGCMETVKHFSVYKSGKSIRIEQESKGSRRWKHSGNIYYSRAAAIINAVTMITGNTYKS